MCLLPSYPDVPQPSIPGPLLTQARGLLPLDLRELGNGVGAITVCEDDTQLLADHFIL